MYHDCSLLHVIYPVVGFPLSGCLYAPIYGQDWPSHSLVCFTYLSLATPIQRMYLGPTIPFKVQNHLIRYMVNPLWNMDTLAHTKAHYGRALHCEVSILLSMICKLCYTIILMIGCTRSLGSTMDFIQVCRWFPIAFGLPIWDPNPQRATLAHIGCA